MNRLKKLAIIIRNFFWWSAGVVPPVLEKCPTNHAKYTAIGVIMVFIAVLASISFAFFLSHTFDISPATALFGGALWGVLIYSLDRAVLTSFRKDETSKIAIAQRFILTVSLALIIGEPLLMHLFRKEIAFEMAQNGQTVAADSRQKAAARFQIEIDSLAAANKEIESRPDTLKADRGAKENAVIGEIEGVSGSGKKGEGVAAKRKDAAFREADAKYKEFKSESAETLLRNKERLAEISREIENEKRIAFPKNKPARVASVESAAETTGMMKLVLSEFGPAPNFKRAANLPNTVEIAGKTGSGMVADFWFFAVAPKVVVGVWVGLPNNEIHLEMDKDFTGGKIAAPVAAKFFQVLQKSNSDLLD